MPGSLYRGWLNLSNEELAAKIQAGERDLLLVLWGQVKGFVFQMAKRRYILTDGLGGVEIEDLVQSGFLALLEAVDAFDPEGEYKFLTSFGFRLRAAFSDAGNYKTQRQAKDPLHRCKSLDQPIDDDPDSGTLLDLQADPGDPFESTERDLWLSQLRSALEKAVDDLPGQEQIVISSRYWNGSTQKEAGELVGISAQRVQQIEKNALRHLRDRAHKNGLEQFVDDRTPYYARVGAERFNMTHTSAVEYAVLERERLERVYRRLRGEAKEPEAGPPI